jgi:hypothetical protein
MVIYMFYEDSFVERFQIVSCELCDENLTNQGNKPGGTTH